jgi:DNA-directed RNA polymerase omega subunit
VIRKDKLENAFEFVTVASARAHQLLRGCTPKIETTAVKKARVAMKEVHAGKVSRDETAADK